MIVNHREKQLLKESLGQPANNVTSLTQLNQEQHIVMSGGDVVRIENAHEEELEERFEA